MKRHSDTVPEPKKKKLIRKTCMAQSAQNAHQRDIIRTGMRVSQPAVKVGLEIPKQVSFTGTVSSSTIIQTSSDLCVDDEEDTSNEVEVEEAVISDDLKCGDSSDSDDGDHDIEDEITQVSESNKIEHQAHSNQPQNEAGQSACKGF
jgi:hypothetical protein